jgi:hypothetical protein
MEPAIVRRASGCSDPIEHAGINELRGNGFGSGKGADEKREHLRIHGLDLLDEKGSPSGTIVGVLGCATKSTSATSRAAPGRRRARRGQFGEPAAPSARANANRRGHGQPGVAMS